MKPLSKTLTELGIEFTFPIIIEDANGYETYYETSKGYWQRCERDADGNDTYFENSDGRKEGTRRASIVHQCCIIDTPTVNYQNHITTTILAVKSDIAP